MNENKKVFSLMMGGKEVTVETGRMAKQADGSVLVSCEGTQVLVTACSAQSAAPGQDFFPLMVEYVEKFYAAGKFLGGFQKREARPTTGETLNARLIDRPLRPLFPKGYMCETIISCTVMSYAENGDAEILAALGATAALCISDIPFGGPIGTVRVGRIDGEYVINPNPTELEKSDMEIVVAANKDAILMVEGEADIVPEDEVLAGILYGQEQIVAWCDMMDKMILECGKAKRNFTSVSANEKMMETAKASFTDMARSAISTDDKLERQGAVRLIEKACAEAMEKDSAAYGLEDSSNFGKSAYTAIDELMYEMMRSDILNEEKRIAGRGMTQVRQIETETSVLTTPHGSSLFTRGETQVLCTTTIGGSKGEQMVDRITGQSYSNFYLHYNFPPYSVGEARGKFSVGRRELGHGNLAERALKAVLPKGEEMNCTVRLCCEVLESNGSSSMGSVCSGSMALMDAGINISAPVAGIAMGLIKEGENFKILTDILGDEDHLGDMDFKVAGTAEGITAIQMDIKITGITKDIVEQSLADAKAGRLHILAEMAKTITVARKEFKSGVPRVESLQIPTDKIGALIGPGGKNIKGLQEAYPVVIECNDDGIVKFWGTDAEAIKNCISTVDLQINGPKINTVYEGKVATIKEYGAFVDIAPGLSGLVHISELADERVSDANEYISEGDIISVKVIDVDRMGRVKLSAKAVRALTKK